MKKVLIADDEESIRLVLSRTLEKLDLEVLVVENGTKALETLETDFIDLALIDIRMPDLTGLEILEQKQRYKNQTKIIIMTAQDTMENAAQAMEKGAYDYITKPFDINEVTQIVLRVLESLKLNKEKHQVENKISSDPLLIGKTKEMKEVFKVIGKIASQDVIALIQGESGTGKELVARAIHSQGNRKTKNFIAVNCSAIPSDILESELFGYKKGAFTGAYQDRKGYIEQADGGTLFLDEIGDMPLDLQSKILRFLQDKNIQPIGSVDNKIVDVRVVAATHKNLEEEVKTGRFRQDLFFRLNVVPMHLPSLRERKEDIPFLVDYFLEKMIGALNVEAKRFTKEALDFLVGYHWPGNVRELENFIKRVLVLSQGVLIDLNDVKEFLYSVDFKYQKNWLDQKLEGIIFKKLEKEFSGFLEEDFKNLYDRYLKDLERPLINLVLKKVGGNQVKASEILGINRNTLRKKMDDLKIE